MASSNSILIILAFVFLQTSWESTPGHAKVNEVNEPPLNVELEVNGKHFSVKAGEPSEVSVDGKKVQVLVTEGDERELRLQHLRFRYPAYFKYEVAFKSGTQVPRKWDLEGQDVDITLYRKSSELLRYQKSKHPFGDDLSERFGMEIVAVEAKVLELGQMKLAGTRYAVPLKSGHMNVELYFDAYEIPGQFGDVRYFLLLVDWDGANLEEERLVRNLLRSSFKVGKDYAKTDTSAIARNTRP